MTLMLCVNNPDNGHFAGKIVAVEFGIALSLECYYAEGVKVRIEGGRLLIQGTRRWFPFTNHQEWVGNWCWDAVQMPWKVAKELLVAMAKRGHWRFSSGTETGARYWEKLTEVAHA